LLLFSDFGLEWRATFTPPWPGPKSATALFFVSPSYPAREEYDSILLDDGTRCFFDRVTPTLAE
jgi:hypothetical protein